MANLSNNLFYYATKELSQDAFICWLCSFALEDSKGIDEELTVCANDLLSEFLKRGLNSEINTENLQLKTIDKQIGNIDVLLTVKYDNKNYKIIIEDKIYSCEHDDQLRRYREQIKSKDVTVIGIYYKTGFQADYSEVEKAGYFIFNRTDIINVLKNCNSTNDIFKNYYEYWKDFEEITQSYKDNKLCDWDWRQINGFYDEIKTLLNEHECWSGYDYVSNKSGGFWGLWYGIDDDAIDFGSFRAAIYLQSEIKWIESKSQYDYKICIKLENQSKDDEKEKMYELKKKILEKIEQYGFTKPNRVGSGTHVTVGVMKGLESISTYEEFRNTIIESVDSYKKMVRDIQQDNKEI